MKRIVIMNCITISLIVILSYISTTRQSDPCQSLFIDWVWICNCIYDLPMDY